MAAALLNPADPPNLDNLSQHLAKLKYPIYMINSDYWVIVVHIESPSSFYVQPSQYSYYLKLIQAKGENIPKNDINEMKRVIFYSHITKHDVRGDIISVNTVDNICTIRAIDFGFIESVSHCNIYYPYQDLKLRPLAAHCQLADCKPIGNKQWDENAKQAMKLYVDDEASLMTIKGTAGGKFIVELRNSNPDDVATLLAYVGVSNFGIPHQEFNKIDLPEPKKLFFPKKELIVGDTLHVRSLNAVTKSLDAFYVAEVRDYKEYIADKADFRTFTQQCPRLSIDDMKEGTPVSVYLPGNNSYERAIIKKVKDPDGKVTVYLIDTGATVDTGSCMMRKMSDKFFTRPPVAMYCSARENQRFDHRLEKFLYPGFEFFITIKQIGDNMCEKPHVVKLVELK